MTTVRLPPCCSLVLVISALLTGSAVLGASNLCSTSAGSDCCPGWRRDEATGGCTIPVCNGDCGLNGHCVGANLCYCPNGIVQYSCLGNSRPNSGAAEVSHQQLRCARPCQNGGHCVTGRCQCPAGFTGSVCQFASCPNFCSGHGRCLSSGSCSCDSGYSGAACDVVDKGPCYSGLSSTRSCTRKLTSAFISREECCNSFGRAWGSACELCRRSVCGFGRVSDGRSCVKLNFCTIPGICSGTVSSSSGICIPEGDDDILCLCPRGESFNSQERRCEVKRSKKK